MEGKEIIQEEVLGNIIITPDSKGNIEIKQHWGNIKREVEQIAQTKSEEAFPYDAFRGKQKGIDDEKTGMALRGAFVAGFEECIKWRSQQPVSIPWLSDEEINQKYPSKKWPDDFNTGKRIAAKEIQTELRKRVIDPVEFLNWCNDIEKCDYYPVYDSDNSSPRHYESRINPSDTKTGSQLLQIYINSKTKEHE